MDRINVTNHQLLASGLSLRATGGITGRTASSCVINERSIVDVFVCKVCLSKSILCILE